MPSNILVFGTGGVGSVYAYWLDKAGANVTCVCRSNYQIVMEEGLHIDSEIFGDVRCKPGVVKSVEEAASTGQVWDYILVTAKALPGTAELIAPAVTPGKTAIALCQNGIGIEEEYVELYPKSTIISAAVYLPATQMSPGLVEHQNLELLELGVFPDDNKAGEPAVKDLAALFTAAGATAKVYDNFQARKWSKLMVNASLNPITALTRLHDVELIQSSPEAIPLMRDVMKEIIAIAHRAGYTNLGDAEIEYHLDRARKRLREGSFKATSMMVDMLHSRRMEVEAILGNALRIARRLEVDTPLLRTIYVLAKGLDYSFEKGIKH